MARSPQDEYTLLLAKLHLLIAAEKGESEEAEAIRDQMDGHWMECSTEAIQQMNELSVKMYDDPELAKKIVKEAEMNGMQIPTQSDELTPYVYVITRSDLSFPQQAVQSGHSLIEATRAFAPTQGAEHPHLVYCIVPNEAELVRLASRLESKGIGLAGFREPDRNNELTAIATECLRGERRSCLRGLKLMKGDSNE